MSATPITIAEALRSVIADFPEIETVILYGSSATGRMTSSSDIDFAYCASAGLPPSRRLHFIGELASKLNRPIDLIQLKDAGPTLIRRILSEGHIIVKRSLQQYTEVCTRVTKDAADFFPQYDSMLKQRAKRFINGSPTS